MASEGGPVVELAPGTRALGRSMGPAKSCSSPVSAFLGLPYAEPPVGTLRFAPPKPIELWTGDRDATKFGAVSPQDMSMWSRIPGKAKIITPTNISEDCLYLNVWTPGSKSGDKKAVMVFIHGGGFIGGYSDLYYGTAVVGLGDVVLVTINYRLNVFGFMTTGDDVMPGNYGILDQIEALKWVKKNISAFGGDPGNVTIFGESAGSCSVSDLLFTRYSKGLFHRAICQSGTAHIPCANPPAAVAFQSTKQFLETLGCTSIASDEVLAFLRNAPVDEMVKAYTPMCLFAPVIEGDVFKAEDFQSDNNKVHPDVDVIIGATNSEGYLMAYMFGNVAFPDKESVAKAVAGMVGPTYRDKTAEAASALVEEYIADDLDEEGRFKAFVSLLSDWYFIYGTVKSAEIQAKSNGRTYVYSFQYRDPSVDSPEWVRADHGADLDIGFGNRLIKEEMSEQMDGILDFEDSDESEEVSRKFISLWTNFAKTGNPNGDGLPKWPQYTTDTREHLIIDSTFSTGRDMLTDKAAFWDKFVAKFPTMAKK